VAAMFLYSSIRNTVSGFFSELAIDSHPKPVARRPY
jgi:hypothetical protein